MALFTRLFKRAEPLTLAQKIDNLKGQPNDELLRLLNSGSTEDGLKHAIVAKLQFGPELLKLATNTPSDPLETHARKRIGDLLDNNELDTQTLNQQLNNQAMLLTLCGYSTNAGVALVEQIDDEALLLSLAATAANTGIRQAAAARINGQDQLTELLKVAKTKDKTVYKIVKAKLDVFKEQRIEQERINDEAKALCHQAELLAKRELDDIFFARKGQIEEAWTKYENRVDDDIKKSFCNTLALSEQKINAHHAEQEQAKAKLQAEKEAKAEIYSTLHKIEAQLSALLTSPEDIDSIDQEVEKAKQQHAEATHTANSNGLKTTQENQKFNELANHAKELIEKIKTHGSVASLTEQLKQASEDSGKEIKKALSSIIQHAKALDQNKTPDAVTHAKQAIKEWTETAKQKANKLKASTDEAFDLIRRGNGAIRSGQVRRAKAIFADIEKSIEKLETLPTALETKFEEIKTSMASLGDWHQFAVTPKKEALIEKMQQLLDATLHPTDLADKIKDLQQQWRELSRGGQHDDSDLWDKFHEAGQKAYEPCKIYFEEQNKIRDENLAKREELLAQLQTYLNSYDWDNANWSDVEKTLRVAREAWQSYWPVARKANKTLQETFDATADAIYQHLNAEYERNKNKKQAIVEQAKSLTELGNTSEAIETAKSLQAKWKLIGRSKAKIDQELWQEFRKHCDEVFDKLKQESAAEQEERNAAKARAEEILAKLDSIIKSSGEAFKQARSETDELIQAFKDLSELPRAHYKAINQAFNNTIERLKNKANEEKAAAKWALWKEVLNTHHKLLNLESQKASGANVEDLQAALHTTLEDASKWPNNCVNALEDRLKLEPSTNDNSVKHLKLLCIRSEIANDATTPEADKALRMQYQVEQLQQGLGNQNPDAQITFEEIVVDWLKVGNVELGTYKELEQRFLHAWKLGEALGGE